MTFFVGRMGKLEVERPFVSLVPENAPFCDILVYLCAVGGYIEVMAGLYCFLDDVILFLLEK